MSEKLSMMALADRVHDEHDAYLFLEELRWDGTPVCPHCGNDDKCYFLKPRNGVSRGTGKADANGQRSQSVRRLWKCGACKKQFTVLVGTIFESSKISLRKWLFVLFEMCANKNGISAREIERRYELSPKSAWFMTHRIREAMRRDPMVGMLQGTNVSDESKETDGWKTKGP